MIHFLLLKRASFNFQRGTDKFIKWKKLRNIFARRLFKQDLASVTCGYLQERVRRFFSKIDLLILARSIIILLNLAYSCQLQILQVPVSQSCKILLNNLLARSCKYPQVTLSVSCLKKRLASTCKYPSLARSYQIHLQEWILERLRLLEVTIEN